MKFLASLILESEDFSINDLTAVQRAALRSAWKGRLNFDKMTDDSMDVLDSLVDLDLLDLAYETTPAGRKAINNMTGFEQNRKADIHGAKRKVARAERHDANRRNRNEPNGGMGDEYYEGFTPGEISAMKASGLNPTEIKELLSEVTQEEENED
jgi:hypothetical protein